MPKLVEQRKVISQQTFDAAVQENEQEFEMDHEEVCREGKRRHHKSKSFCLLEFILCVSSVVFRLCEVHESNLS